MGQDHHIHTKSDPENLKNAQSTYESFMKKSRDITIVICAVLVLMALTLV